MSVTINNSDLSWDTVCSFLDILSRYQRNPYMKSKIIDSFLQRCIRKDSKDAYQVFRLVFPGSDSRSYGINEYRLIYGILVAVDELRNKPDQARNTSLFCWRDKDPLALALGEPRELSALLKERVFEDVCGILNTSKNTKGLRISDVNEKLDSMACARGNFDAQVSIIKWLLERTTSSHMAWLVQVILKHVKIHITETELLEEWSDDGVEKYCSYGWQLSDVLDHDGDREDEPYAGFVYGKKWHCQKPSYVNNIENGYRYMERRFKSDYCSLTVVAEVVGDGIGYQAHRQDSKTAIFCNDSMNNHGTCDIDVFLNTFMEAIPMDMGDFVIEGSIVAWNTSKMCFEPRFVLDQVVSQYGKIYDGFANVECHQYPSYQAPQYADIEILLLVSDVLYLGDEMLVHQALEIRLESLEANVKYIMFDRQSQNGFPIRVKIVPQIPNMSTIAGIPLSIKSSDLEEVAQIKNKAMSLGGKGLRLRALEAAWNSTATFSDVVVLNIIGKFVMDCAVLGAWKDVSGKVTDWLLGIQDCDKSNVIRMLKVKNELHMKDFEIVSSLIGDDSMCTDESLFYPIDGLQKHIILLVAGDILPAGKWNDRHMILNATLLGVSPSKYPISMPDIERMLQRRLASMTRSPRYHFASKGRSVVARFLPCDTSRVSSVSNILCDHVIYFINHTEMSHIHSKFGPGGNHQRSRDSAKQSCEELVKKLGGKVSQNYGPHVDYTVAGHPNTITEFFRKKSIPVLSIEWLKRLLLTRPNTLPDIMDTDYLSEWTRPECIHKFDDSLHTHEKNSSEVRDIGDGRPEPFTFCASRKRFDAACSPEQKLKKPKQTRASPDEPSVKVLPITNPINSSKELATHPEDYPHKGGSKAVSSPAPKTTSGRSNQGKPKLSLKERAKMLGLG